MEHAFCRFARKRTAFFCLTRERPPLVLARAGLNPQNIALDETGDVLAVAAGESGEVLLMSPQSLTLLRRLSMPGMVFDVTLCGGTVHALCLNDALDATLVTVPQIGVRQILPLPGMPGRVTADGGRLLCATEGFLHAVSRDGMRAFAYGACAWTGGRLPAVRGRYAALRRAQRTDFCAEQRRMLESVLRVRGDMQRLSRESILTGGREYERKDGGGDGRFAPAFDAGTTALLALQGRMREAVPLHLCSVSALAAAVLVVFTRAAFLDFLWLLGMPGAVLALVFPAPASSVAAGVHGGLCRDARAHCRYRPSALRDGRRPRVDCADVLLALQPLALRRFLSTVRSERIFCFWPRRRRNAADAESIAWATACIFAFAGDDGWDCVC